MNRQGEGDAPSGRRAVTIAHAVLVCQACPYVWEPAQTDADEAAVLVRTGCPDCGGWIWLGELVGAGGAP